MTDSMHDAPPAALPPHTATPVQPAPPPPATTAQPAPKAAATPAPASRNDIIKTPQRTSQQSKVGATPPAPAPTSASHDTHGPSHVLHIYFPIFDDHESAVQLMHEIYAVTEHYRTSIDGDAVMMIHLPVQQREVVLQMRGTLRDPLTLTDTLKSTIGAEAVVLESA